MKKAFTLLELTAVIAVVGVLVVGVLVYSKGIISSVKTFKEKFPTLSYNENAQNDEPAVPSKPSKPETAPTLSFTYGSYSLTSLQIGATTHTNRTYTISSVHPDYIGAYWYKTAQDYWVNEKPYTDPRFTFTQTTRLYFIVVAGQVFIDNLLSQGFTLLDESEENILDASNTSYSTQLYKDFEAGSHTINATWSQEGVIILVN